MNFEKLKIAQILGISLVTRNGCKVILQRLLKNAPDFDYPWRGTIQSHDSSGRIVAGPRADSWTMDGGYSIQNREDELDIVGYWHGS